MNVNVLFPASFNTTSLGMNRSRKTKPKAINVKWVFELMFSIVLLFNILRYSYRRMSREDILKVCKKNGERGMEME